MEVIDIQLERSPGELRMAIAALSSLSACSKHTGLVAVEGQGFS